MHHASGFPRKMVHSRPRRRKRRSRSGSVERRSLKKRAGSGGEATAGHSQCRRSWPRRARPMEALFVLGDAVGDLGEGFVADIAFEAVLRRAGTFDAAGADADHGPLVGPAVEVAEDDPAAAALLGAEEGVGQPLGVGGGGEVEVAEHEPGRGGGQQTVDAVQIGPRIVGRGLSRALRRCRATTRPPLSRPGIRGRRWRRDRRGGGR